MGQTFHESLKANAGRATQLKTALETFEKPQRKRIDWSDVAVRFCIFITGVIAGYAWCFYHFS